MNLKEITLVGALGAMTMSAVAETPSPLPISPQIAEVTISAQEKAQTILYYLAENGPVTIQIKDIDCQLSTISLDPEKKTGLVRAGVEMYCSRNNELLLHIVDGLDPVYGMNGAAQGVELLKTHKGFPTSNYPVLVDYLYKKIQD